MKTTKENNRLTKAEKKAHTTLRNAKKAKRNIWVAIINCRED